MPPTLPGDPTALKTPGDSQSAHDDPGSLQAVQHGSCLSAARVLYLSPAGR